ncbi:methyl-accepting chemotaxis protein [Virgibacillus proomii]|jgi:methyl-accepting chemotaxis protein|uniref:methyl-accepting chemotaxis protein n=1 Tax=Virgibacillus proomii TaxID=84407 RepID=UPI0009845A37|nr:methyl-accepting chemotaxis protein [Virgibacillus proomii]
MEKVMNFKYLKSKLYVSFMVIIAAICILGIYYFIVNQQTSQRIEKIINEDLTIVHLEEKLNTNFAEQTGVTRAYLLYGQVEYKEKYDQIQTENETLMKELGNLNQLKTMEEFTAKTKQWEEALQEVFRLHDSEKLKEAKELLSNQVEPMQLELQSDLQQALAAGKEEISKDGKSIITSSKTTSLWGLTITIAVALIGIGIAFMTVKLISNPITLVLKRLQQYAQGDLQHESLTTNLRDELGQLIQITNEISEDRNKLIHKVETVSQTVSNHSRLFANSANEVRDGSEQIATTMQELAAGSETQANTASDLAMNMEGFVTKVNETNDNGKIIEQASHEILTMTKEGDKMMKSSSEQMKQIDYIVKSAVDRVKDLDEQSQEINSLVNVVKDISEQTNLLALNAAIEAARAGEHGKGFAVVADEVRKLAEQVSDSVTDITKIVSHIQQNSVSITEALQSSYTEVEAGTAQINTTQETFNGISMFVTEMVQIIKTMATNLEEMKANSSTMNEAIQDIASITEESSAGIEQTAAAAQQSSGAMGEMVDNAKQLLKLADELNDVGKEFQLK